MNITNQFLDLVDLQPRTQQEMSRTIISPDLVDLQMRTQQEMSKTNISPDLVDQQMRTQQEDMSRTGLFPDLPKSKLIQKFMDNKSK